MRVPGVWAATAGIASLASVASAVSLDLTDSSSVNSALALLAQGIMDYNDGANYGGTVGMMVEPYYWWEAGAAWNSILDFWFITGNTTYNTWLFDSLQAQVGKNWDYLPTNQSTTEGNDDQGFWGITAMAAAERNFTNPGSDKPGWLYLAQAVFNEMASRWETADCNGGLRWQIYTWNSGYDYKNTVSNGAMFNLGARLARYTGNTTYSDWAETVYEWLVSVEFLQPGTNGDLRLYDGASLNNNCSDHSNGEWTYNYGLLMSGCAFMYDTSNDTKWVDRATEIWDRATVFFNNSIMYEAACASGDKCNNDQRCFRGIFSRFLGHTVTFIPSLQDDILTYLNASAAAAAQSCSGGTDGHTCGFNWAVNGWDGMYGLGEQMSALECIQNTQILSKAKPLSNDTGGTSVGSDDAGSGSNTTANLFEDDTAVTTKDKAGAGVVTAVILLGLTGVGVWILF